MFPWKLFAFWGKYVIKEKIVYGKKSTKQVNALNYLGCLIGFGVNYDLEKISIFQNIYMVLLSAL